MIFKIVSTFKEFFIFFEERHKINCSHNLSTGELASMHKACSFEDILFFLNLFIIFVLFSLILLKDEVISSKDKIGLLVLFNECLRSLTVVLPSLSLIITVLIFLFFNLKPVLLTGKDSLFDLMKSAFVGALLFTNFNNFFHFFCFITTYMHTFVL